MTIKDAHTGIYILENITFFIGHLLILSKKLSAYDSKKYLLMNLTIELSLPTNLIEDNLIHTSKPFKNIPTTE